MRSSKLLVKGAAPIGAVALVLAGIIQMRAEFWTSGAICLGLALIAFIAGMRQLEKAPFSPTELEQLQPLALPVLGWLTVGALSLIAVVYLVDNRLDAATDRLAAAAWIASMLLAAALVWRWKRPAAGIGRLVEHLRGWRLELLALLTILLLALSLRTLVLPDHPYPWSGDEASVGIEARRILGGEVSNLFLTGWSIQPMWSFVPTALMQLLLGNNILAIRLVSALAGTLAVLFVYLTARELFHPAVALLAAAFLATLPYHVHFSRLGFANIMDSMMSALMFWLLARGMKTSATRYFYAAGAVAGLSFYTYAGTKLIVFLGAVLILFLVIRQRGYLRHHWEHLVAYAAGGLVSAAPQLAYFAKYPTLLLGRFGQEGILLNGWLEKQVMNTGQSALQILWGQLSKTILVFIASPALRAVFNSPKPYLTVLASVLFVLGMAYAIAFLAEPRYFMLVSWFWTVILFGGVLTLNPPANTRLLMSTPPLAILMALGAWKVLEYLGRFKVMPARLAAPILILVTGIVSLQNISYYMGEYRMQMYFQDPSGEFGMQTGMMARDLGQDVEIYVLGEPRVFSNFPTIQFLAPRNHLSDLTAGSLPALSLGPSQKAAFFAIPENHALLQELIHRFPGGVGGTIYRWTKPEQVLLEYYVIGK